MSTSAEHPGHIARETLLRDPLPGDATSSPARDVVANEQESSSHPVHGPDPGPLLRSLPHACACSVDGRNLVLCIDGTSNKFGRKNTNVVELYDRLIKDPKQLTYYISGIGTYAKPSLRTRSFFGRMKRIIGYRMDLIFAWRFERIIFKAYHWLSENYQDGDRIFLFGFSRGAYQVRVLSAMIDRVGLIHKGNKDQIPFAYELYAETGKILDEALVRRANEQPKVTQSDAAAKPSIGDEKTTTRPKLPRTVEEEAETMLLRFIKAFSRRIHVHFVGAWDTVSSVGIVRTKSLPGTTHGMNHICYFRHALALHERRVKFQPEFAFGGLGPPPAFVDEPQPVDTDAPHPRAGSKSVFKMPHTKEVWFAGSHSQIGGGDVTNLDLDKFGPALRWVAFEAELAGIRLEEDPEKWELMDLTVHNSLKRKWMLLELLPLSRLRYGSDEAGKVAAESRAPVFSHIYRAFGLRRTRTAGGLDSTTSWPNLGRPRNIQAHQLVHETAFDYEVTETNIPEEAWRATQPSQWSPGGHGPLTWDKATLGAEKHLEYDSYTDARHILQHLWEHADGFPGTEQVYKLGKLSQNERGRRSLRDSLTNKPSVELILARILNACIRKPDVTPDLGQLSAIVFRSFTVVKPEWALSLLPGRVAEEQLREMDWELSQRCVLSVDMFRQLARAMANADLAIAKRFMCAIGTPSATQILDDSHDEREYTSMASFRSRKLAVVSDSQHIRIWDVALNSVHDFGKTIYIHAVAVYELSDSMFRVAAGDSHGSIRLWEVTPTSMSTERRLGDHSRNVRSVAFSPDGSLIASSSDDGTVKLWDVASGSGRGDVMYHPDCVACVTFSPDGSIIAAGDESGLVILWDCTSCILLAHYAGHTDWVRSVAFSPAGNVVASASFDGTVRLWSVGLVGQHAAETKAALVYSQHEDWVRCVAFSPDSKFVASCSDDKTIRVWSAATGETTQVFRGHTEYVYSVVYMPGGKEIASCSSDGTIRIWSTTDDWLHENKPEIPAEPSQGLILQDRLDATAARVALPPASSPPGAPPSPPLHLSSLPHVPPPPSHAPRAAADSVDVTRSGNSPLAEEAVSPSESSDVEETVPLDPNPHSSTSIS